MTPAGLLARSIVNLAGVRPELKEMWEVMRRNCPDGMVPVVVEGLRSKERQLQMVRERKSQTLDSKHLTGCAIDVVIFLHGVPSYDPELYRTLVSVCRRDMLRLGIINGGVWTFQDWLHWEIAKPKLASVAP